MLILSVISIVAVFILMGIRLMRYGTIVKAWRDILLAAFLIVIQSSVMYFHYEVQRYDLHIPYIIITLLAGTYVLLSVRKYERLRKTEINRASIREAFDDLPSGVCFFNDVGTPVLCNRTMYRLANKLSENELEFIRELAHMKETTDYMTDDGSIWRFSMNEIQDEEKQQYVEIVATDITEQQIKTQKLQKENERLRQMQIHMSDLAKNVEAIAREEEIIAMKMKMHDDIGSCVLASRRFLMQKRPPSEVSDIVKRWRKAIGTIQRDNEYLKNEVDRFQQLRESAQGVGIEINVRGSFPPNDRQEYLIISAIRECVTNTMKHAEGDRVFASISYNDKDSVCWCRTEITNNGRPPAEPVTEGVGLSGMRQKIERAGGTMKIVSEPKFKLIVILPKEVEEK